MPTARLNGKAPAKVGASLLRVAYLEAAYKLIRSCELPSAPPVSQVALAWSFPSKNAREGGKKLVLGECHYKTLDSGENYVIVIHPRVWSAGELEVLAVLGHEMIHAMLPKGSGHGAAFAKAARALGLDGKPTATVPGPGFKLLAQEAMGEPVGPRLLPPFPGGGFMVGGDQRKTQGTRLRLWECACEKPVKVRVCSDDFAATCDVCGEQFELKQAARPAREGKEAAQT